MIKFLLLLYFLLKNLNSIDQKTTELSSITVKVFDECREKYFEAFEYIFKNNLEFSDIGKSKIVNLKIRVMFSCGGSLNKNFFKK